VRATPTEIGSPSSARTRRRTAFAISAGGPKCIRHHTVVEDDCWFNGLYTRVVPSHAIELTAVFLDRNVGAIPARRPNATANLLQKQELAAMIHLCGAASAKAFARRGFRLIAGERCGDHDVATYLAEVNAMQREFLRFGVET
jgi:hypothetical protein